MSDNDKEKSGQLPVQLDRQGRVSAIFNFIRRSFEDGGVKYSTSKMFRFPFIIGTDELKSLENAAKALLDNVVNSEPTFEGIVGFTDLSTRKYDNLATLLENSANDRSPESVILKWSVFDVDVDGSPIYGSIKIDFVTEMELENQEIGLGEISVSSIVLTCDGSDDEWVQAAFNRLAPFIKSSQISKLFLWMAVFRNRWFIEIAKNFSGIAGMCSAMYYANIYFDNIDHQRKLTRLIKITSSSSLDKKFDEFVQQYVFPDPVNLMRSFVPLSLGLMMYFATSLLAMYLLPKFAPRSSILIGLSGKIKRDSQNLIRFILVNVLILGILLPILLSYFHFT